MLKLLIADDLELSRKCLAMFLSRHGYQVIEAEDGEEALRLTRRERPDLVIADLLMPTMDGFEFVRAVRNDAAIAQTPVIFLSANFPTEEVEPIARSLGVEHILQKTFAQTPILEAIRETTLKLDCSEISVRDHDFQREHLRLMSEKLAKEFEGFASLFIDFLNKTPLASESVSKEIPSEPA